MIGLLCFVLAVLASPFKSKIRLEAENAVLRHQLTVLRRRLRGHVRLTNNDRWFFVLLYRRFPSILHVLTIIRPETLMRWHRSGFRCYWRWKSRSLGGRPQIEAGLRALIRQMSVENPLWGAPRIHGELLKLGFEGQLNQASPSTWSNGEGRGAQGWRTLPAQSCTQISPPWTSSLFQPSVSICSMSSSSSDWTAGIWSGSTSQGIRRPNGLPAYLTTPPTSSIAEEGPGAHARNFKAERMFAFQLNNGPGVLGPVAPRSSDYRKARASTALMSWFGCTSLTDAVYRLL